MYFDFLLRSVVSQNSLNPVKELKALKAMFSLLKFTLGAPITLVMNLYYQLVSPIHMIAWVRAVDGLRGAAAYLIKIMLENSYILYLTYDYHTYCIHCEQIVVDS